MNFVYRFLSEFVSLFSHNCIFYWYDRLLWLNISIINLFGFAEIINSSYISWIYYME